MNGKPIAIAGPPLELALPLVAGYVYGVHGPKNCYSKNDNGLVVVHFAVTRAANSGGIPVGITTFANLPVGFRPLRLRAMTSATKYTPKVTEPATVYIRPQSESANGDLVITNSSPDAINLSGTLVFYTS